MVAEDTTRKDPAWRKQARKARRVGGEAASKRTGADKIMPASQYPIAMIDALREAWAKREAAGGKGNGPWVNVWRADDLATAAKFARMARAFGLSFERYPKHWEAWTENLRGLKIKFRTDPMDMLNLQMRIGEAAGNPWETVRL